MYCLLEIVAIARHRLASQFIKHLDWIKVEYLTYPSLSSNSVLLKAITYVGGGNLNGVLFP